MNGIQENQRLESVQSANPLTGIKTESWLPVVNWENFYSISSAGRVLSIKRKVIHKNGFIQTIHQKILIGTISFYGYRCVDLRSQGKRRNAKVHKLVMEAFVGECPKNQEVRHLDGNRLNNHFSNLKYGTRQDNVNDTKKHGKVPSGEKHWNSKLSNAEVVKIYNSNQTITLLARQHKVSFATIYDIKKERCWRQITK